MTGEEVPHLSQRQLMEIEDIQSILGKLGKFLETAAFAVGRGVQGVEMCTDKDLPKASKRLLSALDFGDKIKSKTLKFNVLRIRQSARIIVTNPTALVPVQSWGRIPTISAFQLDPGTMIHVTEDVQVTGEDDTILDLLFVSEKS